MNSSFVPDHRLSTRWLLETCKAKLIPAVERLQREREDAYIQKAVAALRDEMARLVPMICTQARRATSFTSIHCDVSYCPPLSLLKHSPLPPSSLPQISEELVRPGFRKSSSFSSTSRPAPSKNPMLQFPVVLHLITSPYFRPTTVTPQLIADLASYLVATTGPPPSTAQAAAIVEFKASLMHVLEAICQVGSRPREP